MGSLKDSIRLQPAAAVWAAVEEGVMQQEGKRPPLPVGMRYVSAEDMHAPAIALYGEPGCGKTLCAAGAPDPVFFASEPEGLQTLIKHGLHPPWIEVSSVADVEGGCRKVREMLRMGHPVQTVVIDTISTLSDRLLNATLKALGIGTDGIDLDIDPRVWSFMLHEQQRAYDAVRKLGLISVWVAHVETKGGFTKGVAAQNVISAQGKFRERIRAYVSAVFYMEAKKDAKTGGTVRVLHTEPYGTYHAKSRLAGLGQVEPADLSLILRKAGCI